MPPPGVHASSGSSLRRRDFKRQGGSSTVQSRRGRDRLQSYRRQHPERRGRSLGSSSAPHRSNGPGGERQSSANASARTARMSRRSWGASIAVVSIPSGVGAGSTGPTRSICMCQKGGPVAGLGPGASPPGARSPAIIAWRNRTARRSNRSMDESPVARPRTRYLVAHGDDSRRKDMGLRWLRSPTDG
jgi:hypothetical protein